MAFYVENDGTLVLVQGDSGNLVINDIPTDKNYQVFFAIYDENRKTIGSELSVETGGSSVVSITLNGDYTNLLKVPLDDEFATYYYGVKLCNTLGNTEDTLLINDGQIGDINEVRVYPRKVEGI